MFNRPSSPVDTICTYHGNLSGYLFRNGATHTTLLVEMFGVFERPYGIPLTSSGIDHVEASIQAPQKGRANTLVGVIVSLHQSHRTAEVHEVPVSVIITIRLLAVC